jgi:hypothetical protein
MHLGNDPCSCYVDLSAERLVSTIAILVKEVLAQEQSYYAKRFS